KRRRDGGPGTRRGDEYRGIVVRSRAFRYVATGTPRRKRVLSYGRLCRFTSRDDWQAESRNGCGSSTVLATRRRHERDVATWRGTKNETSNRGGVKWVRATPF